MSKGPSVVILPDSLNVTSSFKPADTLAVDKGPVQKLNVSYQAQSWSDNGFTFDNIIPSSEWDILDRILKVKYYVAIGLQTPCVVNGTAVGPRPTAYTDQENNYNKDLGEGLYLRPYPLNQATATTTLKINGVATSFSPQDIIPIMMPTIDPSFSSSTDSSTYPTGMDIGALFSQRMCTGVPAGPSVQPLAAGNQYTASNLDPYVYHGKYQSRGLTVQWKCLDDQHNGTATALDSSLWQAYVEEDLIIPPFAFGNADGQEGITHVQNLTVMLTFASLQRMVSLFSAGLGGVAGAGQLEQVVFRGIPVVNPTVISVTLQARGAGYFYAAAPGGVNNPVVESPQWTPPAPPSLEIMYNTLSSAMANKIDSFVSLYYNTYNTYLEPIPTMTVQDAVIDKQLTTQTMRLSNIPAQIVIGVRPRNSAYQLPPTGPGTIGQRNISGCQLTNHWLPIKSLTLTYNTRPGIFSTYSMYDLWRMTRKNGAKCTFFEYCQGAAPIIINTAFDIGLENREAAGQATIANLQFQITYRPSDAVQFGGIYDDNIFPIFNYDCYVTTVTPARAVVGGGTCTFAIQGPSQSVVLGMLQSDSSKDYIAKSQVPAADDGAADGKALGGGGFHRIANYLKTGAHAGLSLLADNPDLVHGAIKGVRDVLGGDMTAGDVTGGKFSRHPRAK